MAKTKKTETKKTLKRERNAEDEINAHIVLLIVFLRGVTYWMTFFLSRYPPVDSRILGDN